MASERPYRGRRQAFHALNHLRSHSATPRMTCWLEGVWPYVRAFMAAGRTVAASRKMTLSIWHMKGLSDRQQV